MYHLESKCNTFRLLFKGRNVVNAETTTSKNTTVKSKVKLSVYYETLCPASVDFFITQLQPAVERLSSHMDVHLIPYGHARSNSVVQSPSQDSNPSHCDTRHTRGRYQFSCQHGPAECYGNKLHACAIEAAQNTTTSVLLNACLMQYSVYKYGVGYDYSAAVNWCTYKLNVAIDGIRHCVNNERGSILLKDYGEETHRLRPRYVPFVILDNSTDEQDEATGNLIATICHKLDPKPAAC
ncbi:gamma-interferon-inducible lysosomal thiol reductase-like isoform X2 [Pectinophora gossypiella]|uniref:gamma-interferon-inducible lysosomal thiol reductase-like isoform X2 n=1 Tax=Pectinophora gossypiella TaxID=13191 RepID=UPI00214E1DAD|nr:gamma-interferon-inducible lysosomal thiol reductase-like isoform X2 [Pectinophora gossypiella]